jgi:hypothetical protein
MKILSYVMNVKARQHCLQCCVLYMCRQCGERNILDSVDGPLRMFVNDESTVAKTRTMIENLCSVSELEEWKCHLTRMKSPIAITA